MVPSIPATLCVVYINPEEERQALCTSACIPCRPVYFPKQKQVQRVTVDLVTFGMLGSEPKVVVPREDHLLILTLVALPTRSILFRC